MVKMYVLQSPVTGAPTLLGRSYVDASFFYKKEEVFKTKEQAFGKCHGLWGQAGGKHLIKELHKALGSRGYFDHRCC